MSIPRTSFLPTNRAPTPPGEFILKDWLEPTGETQLAFAARLGVPLQRLNGIVRGRRAVTAETAILLARELKGSTPEFWLTLQMACDLYAAQQKMKAKTPTKPRARAAA